jgi:hypothetical protein
MPIIPAAWEEEVREWWYKASLDKSMRPYLKKQTRTLKTEQSLRESKQVSLFININ